MMYFGNTLNMKGHSGKFYAENLGFTFKFTRYIMEETYKLFKSKKSPFDTKNFSG